MKEIPNS